MREIRPAERIDCEIIAPSSKSITHRALIMASLAHGDSRIYHPLICEDTLYTLRAMKRLGARIVTERALWHVGGVAGRISPGKVRLYLGNSGTSVRLLTGVVSIGRGEYLIEGDDRMAQRPIQDLLNALLPLGVRASSVMGNGCPPLRINTQGLMGGRTRLRAEVSSQYLSSLLIAAPYAHKDVEIEVLGGLASRPYIDLTIKIMEDFGVQVKMQGDRTFLIRAKGRYQGRDYTVEGDYSSASYFLAAAAVTGGRVRVRNLNPSSIQPDRGLLTILERMGCRVRRASGWVEVSGRADRGIQVNMNRMPDMVPTVAVLGAFAQGDTVITGVPHLRYKESDRIGGLVRELRRLGAQAQELKDGLLIRGGRPLVGGRVISHGDHRMAMAFAIAGLKVRGLMIEGEGCVRKSFPDFWKRWEGLYR